MRRLLVVHVLHERTQRGVPRDERRGLAGVDEGGGELAGLVDAQGGGEELALLGSEGFFTLGICCR